MYKYIHRICIYIYIWKSSNTHAWECSTIQQSHFPKVQSGKVDPDSVASVVARVHLLRPLSAKSQYSIVQYIILYYNIALYTIRYYTIILLYKYSTLYYTIVYYTGQRAAARLRHVFVHDAQSLRNI